MGVGRCGWSWIERGWRVEERELGRKRNGQKQVASAMYKDQSSGFLRTGGQHKWGLLNLGQGPWGCILDMHTGSLSQSRPVKATILFDFK